MKFKDYKIAIINEASVTDSSYYEAIDMKSAIEILKTKCKKYDPDHPIMRGMSGNSRSMFGIIEGEKGGRKSQNTSNQYTVILDNLIASENSKYPLRSKSIICSTIKTYASRYGDLYYIIPYDDTIIGVVDDKDIWYIELGDDYSVKDMNDLFKRANIGDSSFSQIVSDLKKLDPEKYTKEFESFFGKQSDVENGIKKAYDLNKLRFKFTTQDKLSNAGSELWISGKCLVISSTVYDSLIKHHDELTNGYDVYIKNGLKYYTPDEYVDFGDSVIVNSKFKFIDLTKYEYFDKVERDDFFGKDLIKYVKKESLSDYKEHISDDSFHEAFDEKGMLVKYLDEKIWNQESLSQYFDFSGITITYNKDKNLKVTFAFYKIDGVAK